MKKLYQNRDTGELLSYNEMLKQWAEDYDGDDPSNGLGWAEQYSEIEVPETRALYTMEDWQKDTTFKADAGQEVSEEVYNAMLNCMPPKSLPRNKARQALSAYNIPVHAGYLMGEPYSSKNGQQLYLAFGMNDYGKGKHYYYLGLSVEQPELNGRYYFFDCLGLIFNGDRTDLPDNYAPVATFNSDEEAITAAANYEATLYKLTYQHDELVERLTLYEPKY